MKTLCHIATGAIVLIAMTAVQAQKYEKVRFGDFEHWTVRSIKESAVLGGATQNLYVVGPTDTIVGNKTYDYRRTIWASSNAYAVVMGITKTSCSVTPDKGPTGRCAKLMTRMAHCKAIGIINIDVLSQGSIFWGRVLEPIKGTDNPMANMDWGIPFTKKPKAVVLDYRAIVPNTGKLIKGKKTIEGYDPEEVMFILQNRWEDAKGNIHAKRVGTAYYRISKSSTGWVKGHRIEVIYGDARTSPDYKPYMNLKTGDNSLYAVNSKGKNVRIIEEGWGDDNTQVTHAIMCISTGTRGSFTGALDNTLWVDNIKLEY